MKRYLVAPLLVVLVACSSSDFSESPAGRCLQGMGYSTEDGRTYLRDGSEAITLAKFDGVVQPVTEQDLHDYVAAGCR